MSKVDYVRSQGQTRDHHCHWPGCTRQVPPAKWGCLPHWRALPIELQRRIWLTFRPGQEKDGRPSRDYLEAARAVQAWIQAHHQPPASTPPTPVQRALLE